MAEERKVSPVAGVREGAQVQNTYLGYHTTVNPTSLRGLPRRLVETSIENAAEREYALKLWDEQHAAEDTPEARMAEMAAWGVFAHPEHVGALEAAQATEDVPAPDDYAPTEVPGVTDVESPVAAELTADVEHTEEVAKSRSRRG